MPAGLGMGESMTDQEIVETLATRVMGWEVYPLTRRSYGNRAEHRLIENVEHHIQEEEGDMFRKARGIFSREELEALVARMAKMKAEARG